MTDQKSHQKATQNNGSCIEPEADLKSQQPMAYQSPTLKIDRLALITLGGSPNPGDSGTEGTQGPPQ